MPVARNRRRRHRRPSKPVAFAWFATHLPGFLRRQLTLEDARRELADQLATRDARFLDTVRRYVFSDPRSPYRTLLELAGCEEGDLESLVRDRGIEGALRQLRSEGVYLSFEEFKGRRPVVRDGAVIDLDPMDLVAPGVRGLLTATTGGTTGTATPVQVSLRRIALNAPPRMVAFAAHGVMGRPFACWREMPPSLSGLVHIIQDAYLGQRHDRWFCSPLPIGRRKRTLYALATECVRAAAHFGGVSIPRPDAVDAADAAGAVVDWAAATTRSHGGSLVVTGVSQAVRVSRAARERGIDLTGLTLMAAGEPPTPAKVDAILASGAAWLPHYTLTEVGRLGIGCARPSSGSDMHLLDHLNAVIQYPRALPGTELTLDTVHVTSLTPETGLLCLNVELDDFATIEDRSCGCLLEEAGFTRHISDVQSFAKLTSEGVTLLGTEVVRILEEVLPMRFGGSALDFQLVEDETPEGQTKLLLLVDPRVDIADADVATAFLDAIGRSNLAVEIRTLWQNAGTLEVRREQPRLTRAGKQFPIVPRWLPT